MLIGRNRFDTIPCTEKVHDFTSPIARLNKLIQTLEVSAVSKTEEIERNDGGWECSPVAHRWGNFAFVSLGYFP
jgi:hypothetical protein